MDGAAREFTKLIEIMSTLRAPGGCPWDREQTLGSLRRYAIEETYEVVDAIAREDWDALAEELGDLQLQIVFQSAIAREEGLFDIARVLRTINEKLIRRHPHVFENEPLDTAEEVTAQWEEIKAREKPPSRDAGRLDSVSRNQPALLEARQIGVKAAKAGFDWRCFDELGDKLDEEFGELREAITSGESDSIEDEVGDLLFMAVNVARFAGADPELALKRANAKFRDRFGKMEAALEASGRRVEDCPLEELETLWQRAKSS